MARPWVRHGFWRPAFPVVVIAKPPTDYAAGAWLVYDGQCPFCSAYVKYMRVRESLGTLQLVDARDGGPLVDEIVRAGIDLDEGMVLKVGSAYYHGADCIHALAWLSTRSGVFNRINAGIFRSPFLARWLYPVLRAGRNVALRLLRRSKLNMSEAKSSARERPFTKSA